VWNAVLCIMFRLHYAHLLLLKQHGLGFVVDVTVNINLRGDQKQYIVYCCADKD
jgi:hypothetical protein